MKRSLCVTFPQQTMKRDGDWREKIDASGLDILEGFRKALEVRHKFSDPSALHKKLEEIATEHPEIRVLGQVTVLPEFLDLLLKNEETAKILSNLQSTPGSKTMSEPAAQFVDVMQSVSLGLEDPELRLGVGVASGLAAVVLGGIYRNISRSHFGDAGPTKKGEAAWTLGMTLEALAKILKGEKPPEKKRKVNVELIELTKVVRKHAKSPLTYRELRDALEYAGVHVSDEEALRLLVWRARKKGWIKPEESPET
jgi:hypothetical protein